MLLLCTCRGQEEYSSASHIRAAQGAEGNTSLSGCSPVALTDGLPPFFNLYMYRREFLLLQAPVPQVGWLYSSVLLQVAGLMTFTDAFGSTSSLFDRMFQCVKCEFTTRDKEKVVWHFLQEHLKLCQVPYVCEQYRFRVCTRCAIINHQHDRHQAPEGDLIDEICYGTLDPIPEDDIFKMQSPLCHPGMAQADKPKQQSWKELPPHTSYRERHQSSKGFQRTQFRHRGRSHSRSQECW